MPRTPIRGRPYPELGTPNVLLYACDRCKATFTARELREEAVQIGEHGTVLCRACAGAGDQEQEAASGFGLQAKPALSEVEGDQARSTPTPKPEARSPKPEGAPHAPSLSAVPVGPEHGIWFCADCGVSLTFRDFMRGAAREQEGVVRCLRCRGDTPAAGGLPAGQAGEDRPVDPAASLGAGSVPGRRAQVWITCDGCRAPVSANALKSGAARVIDRRILCFACQTAEDQGPGAASGFGLQASDQAGATPTLKPGAWSLKPGAGGKGQGAASEVRGAGFAEGCEVGTAESDPPHSALRTPHSSRKPETSNLKPSPARRGAAPASPPGAGSAPANSRVLLAATALFLGFPIVVVLVYHFVFRAPATAEPPAAPAPFDRLRANGEEAPGHPQTGSVSDGPDQIEGANGEKAPGAETSPGGMPPTEHGRDARATESPPAELDQLLARWRAQRAALDPALERMLTSEQADEVLAGLVAAVADGAVAAAPLALRRLTDADPRVRRAAAAALGALGDDRAVSALLGATRDADEDVRRAAADALTALTGRKFSLFEDLPRAELERALGAGRGTDDDPPAAREER